jgi:type IV pilus assembly protein PilA
MQIIQKGFTLIELMIVVAIIGILAAIALPAYQDYTIRAQVSEGPTLAEGLKLALADYYTSNGVWPADETKVGFTAPPSGTYVTQVKGAAGSMVITYGNKANKNVMGGILTIGAATDPNGDIAWVCGTATMPNGFAGTSGAIAAPLVPKWLPSSCKP